LLFPPKLIEGFGRKIKVCTLSGPSLEQFIDHPILDLAAAKIHHFPVKHSLLPGCPSNLFYHVSLPGTDRLSPVVQQELMQVNLYRAYFRTIPTKGRSMAQVFPFTKVFEIGCNDAADGATVGSSITMPPNILIYRTGVQASSATDTIKAFP
jgi:hypothetical protein